LAAFRRWLDARHGGLDGLNRAWKRRYVSWEDVQPGKLPPRPYTEMMEFEAFLQWRAAEHARFRYEVIRGRDRSHVITAHGPQPSFAMAGDAQNHAMNRGHDFDVAAPLDGFGVSHFPFWFRIRDEDFGVRVESTRSAAAGKLVWVSELQGGSARQGFSVFPSVRAKPQQRWVWNGFGRGAKAVIFWCWRDEVFGKESSGYGLAGMDGFAEERLAAMRETAEVLRRHDSLLEAYQPDPARAGVWIDTNTYNLEWAQDGSASRARASVTGWMSCFERIGVPYDLLDSGRFEGLDRLRLLVMPFPLVVPEAAAARILDWVRRGGWLVTEAELDSFSNLGLYRYPGPDRTFAHALGIQDTGRRVLERSEVRLRWEGRRFELRFETAKATQVLQSLAARETGEFLTPLVADVGASPLAADRAGNVLALSRSVGEGRVIAFAGYLGRAYDREPYAGLERFLSRLAEGVGAVHGLDVRARGRIQWRTGLGGDERLLFVVNPGRATPITVSGDASLFGRASGVQSLRSGSPVPIRVRGSRRGFRAAIEAGGWAAFSWRSAGR
jgi:beta-galactosidase